MSNVLIVKPEPIAGASASGTASGYQPDYVGNDYMGVVWKSVAGSTATLIVDLGANVGCDTALLLGCDGATAGMTLKVEASTAAQGAGFSPAGWTGATLPFLAGSDMPADRRGIALWQAPDGAGPPASRYWRFTIGGLAGGKATVARVVLGKRIALERNFSFGAAFGVKDTGSIDWSRLGVMLRKRGRKFRTLGLSFAATRRDEVEASVKPLMEALGNTDMVAIVSDPAPDAKRQLRTYYGPCIGDLSAIWRRADMFQWGIDIVSLI